MKISFLPALALLFIGLRLAEVISWSWWLVLFPLYGPFLVAFVVLAAMFGILLVIERMEK